MTRFFKRISFLAEIMTAVVIFIFFLITTGSLYRARQRFYSIAQSEKGAVKRIVLSLLDGPVASMAIDYQFLKENISKDQLSQLAVQQYSDETLSGYGDIEFQKGGETVHEQQRGLILPTLERLLVKRAANVVVEIGTGNGDVIAFLAQSFPENEYIGIDFSVAAAQRKHEGVGNLRFEKGYALELIENGTVKGDVVFGSSTFILFNPKELARYLQAFNKVGVREIVLNEPCWSGYIQDDNGGVASKHLEGACWYHNYCGYLREANFDISELSSFHYDHPVSNRPDIFVSIIHGVAKK